MTRPRRAPVAWVESPLQVLGVAEYASLTGRPVDLLYRPTSAQMSDTADELRQRGAAFASVVACSGIPWSALRAQRDWIIGDGFSGQFRAAVVSIRPSSVTLLDDGDMTLHLAGALLGQSRFSRRDQRDGAVMRALGGAARGRLLRLARSGRLSMFTSFGHHAEVAALASLDIVVRANEFDWLRAHATPRDLPHDRVVLGSAGVVDGLLDAADYVSWVRSVADHAPIAYLPHRRETAEGLARVAQVDGVTIVDSGLPAELTLAGTTAPLEIITKRSTASTTLRAVLRGSGSAIGEWPPPADAQQTGPQSAS